MRAFLCGLAALVLVIVPMLVLVLLHAHASAFTPQAQASAGRLIITSFLFGWPIALIVAIVGLRARIRDEDSERLHYLGKWLCVAALVTQIFCCVSTINSCNGSLSGLH